jgi:chromosome segregation ATPase
MFSEEFTKLVYALAALGSVIAAVLAWIAKLRWASEYEKAKNAQIDSLKSQIETLEKSNKAEGDALRAQIAGLEKFLPADVWHQYDHLKKFLQEARGSLQERDHVLEQKQAEISALNERNAALADENASAAKVLQEMTEQMQGLRDSVQVQLRDVEQQIDGVNARLGSGEIMLPRLRLKGTRFVG